MKIARLLPFACALLVLSASPGYTQEDQFNSNSTPALSGGASGGSIPSVPSGCGGPGGCPGSDLNNGPTGTQTANPSNTGCGNSYGCANTTAPTGTQAVPATTLKGSVQQTAPLQTPPPLQGSVQQTAPLQTPPPLQGSVQQTAPLQTPPPLQGSAKQAAPSTGSATNGGRAGAVQNTLRRTYIPSRVYSYPATGASRYGSTTTRTWRPNASPKVQVPSRSFVGRSYNPSAHSPAGFQNLQQFLPGIIGAITGAVQGALAPHPVQNPQPYQYQNQYQYPYGQRTYTPPSSAYPYERTPSVRPRAHVQRGIAVQPKVLDVPIPAQGSLFVPGLQNVADMVNFLSTYHPVETLYAGLAIAGGELAGMGIVPSEVTVADAVGGKLYKLNAKVLNPRNPLDASVNPKLPKLQLLDRPIARNATQNAIKDEDLKMLRSMRVTSIRVNQQQLALNEKGELIRVGINRPDVQFTYRGQRYYIEYDTPNSTRGIVHAMRILANDPEGIVILITAP